MGLVIVIVGMWVLLVMVYVAFLILGSILMFVVRGVEALYRQIFRR
jgi:hypothetical protein